MSGFTNEMLLAIKHQVERALLAKLGCVTGYTLVLAPLEIPGQAAWISNTEDPAKMLAQASELIAASQRPPLGERVN